MGKCSPPCPPLLKCGIFMRLSLHTKLLVSYIGFMLIVVGAVYVYLNTALQQDVVDQTRQQLLNNARLVQSYLESFSPSPLTSRDIDPLADRLGAQSSVRVTIVLKDGTVVGDSSIPLDDISAMENHGDRPEILSAYAEGVGKSIRYSETLKTDMAYVAVPFRGGGAVQGVVRVAFPLQGFQWIESHIWKIILAALSIGLIFAIILSYMTERLVSKPIEEMTAVARRQAAGDLSVTATVPGHTELYDLATALNAMAAESKTRLMQITQENAQLEAVLSGMAEGVMVTDASGLIIMINPAFARMMDLADWRGHKKPMEVIRNHELQGAVDTMCNAVPPAEKDVMVDLTLVHHHRTLQVYLTPIRIEEALYGVVAVFHDITELRRLEDVRKDFVANVSHELRTPLTSIIGYVETLLNGALEDADTAARFATSIQHHAHRLQALIEDLLQLSRIESGRMAVQLESCAMDQIADRVLTEFGDLMDRKHITWTFDSETHRPVSGQDSLLERVIFNLIDNAVKYAPEQGRITIRMEEKGGEVLMAIADTGIGIPSEALPRIFERFFRVDRARSRDLGGTGLGLAIVKHTMDLLGGRVWVDSQVGAGTTFYLALPVWEEGQSI
jgi:two-component system phosphate regulon sensor histidine kinase PhoR